MADKETTLSIVLRTVDKATAKIKAVNERIAAATKPIRDFKEALSDLRSKSGLDDVIGGFKGVGGAIAELLGKVAMIGGVVGLATAGVFKLVSEFDDLGDKAEAAGVSADFLAQLRYAAERSGVAVESLDQSLLTFSKSLGLARAGTGKMAKFLGIVSPALLEQLKAAKSNEAAFDLLADAFKKIEDPAKAAALAQATFGDAAAHPLLRRGAKDIKALRDRFAELAPGQAEAAAAAGEVDDSLKDLKASTQGIKAAIVTGLAPALKVIVEQLRDWFKENRANVKAWAADLGKRLPGAVEKLVAAVRSVIDFVRPFVDTSTKLKIALVAVAAVIAGPLISALVSLGIAILSTPVGWILAGIAALAVAWYVVITRWDEVKQFFIDFWDTLEETFGPAVWAIKISLMPFIGVAALLIGAWEPVKDFFVTLWDGITGAFQKAWDFIKSIVDKIVGAVETVVGGIKKVGDVLGVGVASKSRDAFDAIANSQGGAALPGLLQQSRDALGARSSTEARVTVDFANAPRGTRVTTDPQSTADVETNVGYQLGFAP